MNSRALFCKLKLASSSVLFLFTAALSMNAVASENSIEKVEFSQASGDVLVKLTLRQPVTALPSAFAIASPPRVAFDFLDTENSTPSNNVAVGIGALRSINIIQAGNRTRLVFNLLSSTQYTLQTEGNNIFITLPTTGVNSEGMRPKERISQGTQPASTPSSPATLSNTSLIQDIDFRVENTDLAVVKISTSDANALLDVKQQGNDLVLSMPGNMLPDKLVKRLDVRDFGTVVESVSSRRNGQGTQITFTNRGDWDYNVRQLDNQIYVEVRRIVEDPNSLASSKDVKGKVVSFNFSQPVPVSQMIGLFQDITGLNFMIMPGVAGEIQSLKMENTPADVAIDIISRMYGLGFRRYGNIVVVGKADDLAKYDKDERDRTATLANSEPIQQETFKIKYRTASDVVQRLTSNAGPNGAAAQGAAAPQQQQTGNTTTRNTNSLISERGTITFDDATNTIFVEESKTRLNKIRDRIVALDRPMRQVLIEARIVQAQDDFTTDLGVKLSASAKYTIGNLPSGGQTVSFNPGYSLSGTSTLTGISLFNAAQTRIVNLQLAASESDTKIKKIASPKILTRDTQKATLINGQAIPYQSSAGASGATTTSFVNAALTLDVTPQIQQDGRIQLDLNVSNDEPTTISGASSPGINKRNITTKVVIENGGTVVIGGMYKQDETNNEDRIPFFGDLPYVGFLFKNKHTVKSRSELLVFITPRVVSEDLVLQQ
ncbi:MAG: type IV pilus secretin family protein [Rhodocyclaceae bacterium]|nr:MAG: type IV pilus secretin family protein [Rhodocyclaceae bacterium]